MLLQRVADLEITYAAITLSNTIPHLTADYWIYTKNACIMGIMVVGLEAEPIPQRR